MVSGERVVVVTGASSGVGNACATFLAKKGEKVYGTCRNPSTFVRKADEFFEMLPMDITDKVSVEKAAERILGAEKRVDCLVCCAGSGLLGSIEDSSLEEAASIMDLDYLGTVRVIKAFLPSMREAGGARIVIVNGFEGAAPPPYQGFFAAAEGALVAFAESLRAEVLPFGIEVGVLELGPLRTSFVKNRVLAAGAGDRSPYRDGFESATGVLARDEAASLDPLLAAKAIYKALSAYSLPRRGRLGSLPRRALAWGRRWLPAAIYEFLSRQYYRQG
jgi:short-subunit dehydrogenase